MNTDLDHAGMVKSTVALLHQIDASLPSPLAFMEAASLPR